MDQAQDKKESSGDVVPYKQPGGLSFLIYDPKYAPKAPGSTNQAHQSKSHVDETKSQKKETKKALERARKIMKMKFELRVPYKMEFSQLYKGSCFFFQGQMLSTNFLCSVKDQTM